MLLYCSVVTDNQSGWQLINVQIKVGELYINRSKQSKEVSDRFKKYFSSNNYGFIND
jgi:hypothetical protein